MKKIRENTKKVIEKCREKNSEVAAVTKVFAGDKYIIKSIIDSGINILADSRLKNLKKFNDLKIKKMLIRIPMKSEIEEVVKYTDISLNSELETIFEINKYAKIRNKIYEIMLMIDVGDLREGIFFENYNEIYNTVKNVIKLKNIKLKGLGTNFSCFGGVIPSEEKYNILINIKNRLEKDLNIKIKEISGGSSGTLSLIDEINIPKDVNQLRCGASIALGIGLNDMPFEYLHQNTCEFAVELVEIKKKILNNKIKKIGVCIINTPGMKKEYFIPTDKKIKIIDINNDYIILDLTESEKKHNLNDEIFFNLSYGGLLLSMNSPYVRKVYLNNL
ncbi:alanine racemase [Marinitoga aeolica]|uniref:Alanine racemase n=1 Tax=Marinitoga aeolica TaxID=2809031 RepID=A0ABY8PQL5_9BACT|nr:alanine racemase [Marinitoga aeolica]WGS64941.1 alanine racemase [Marinitoga aeolica]